MSPVAPSTDRVRVVFPSFAFHTDGPELAEALGRRLARVPGGDPLEVSFRRDSGVVVIGHVARAHGQGAGAWSATAVLEPLSRALEGWSNSPRVDARSRLVLEGLFARVVVKVNG